jgi:hypothetical protein
MEVYYGQKIHGLSHLVRLWIVPCWLQLKHMQERCTIPSSSWNVRLDAQSTVVAADGSQQSTYEYNDRGRGPKTASTVKVDAEGWPVSIEITVVDYLKRLWRKASASRMGLRRWKNQAESGEKKLTATRLFTSA